MTKTYVVTPSETGEELFRVRVEVIDEAGNVILTGETQVNVTTPEEAAAYVEDVFLPDLRRNMPKRIGDLILPGDATPEEVIDGEPEPTA